MYSIIKNITSLGLGLLLLISISGVRVYSHYCENSGYSNSSLFENVAECNHAKASSVVKSDDCCSIANVTKTVAKDEDCCNTIEQEIKLNLEFEYTFENPKVASVYDFVFEELIRDSQENGINKDQEIDIHEIFRPPSGRRLLVYLHRLSSEPFPTC